MILLGFVAQFETKRAQKPEKPEFCLMPSDEVNCVVNLKLPGHPLKVCVAVWQQFVRLRAERLGRLSYS